MQVPRYKVSYTFPTEDSTWLAKWDAIADPERVEPEEWRRRCVLVLRLIGLPLLYINAKIKKGHPFAPLRSSKRCKQKGVTYRSPPPKTSARHTGHVRWACNQGRMPSIEKQWVQGRRYIVAPSGWGICVTEHGCSLPRIIGCNTCCICSSVNPGEEDDDDEEESSNPMTRANKVITSNGVTVVALSPNTKVVVVVCCCGAACCCLG